MKLKLTDLKSQKLWGEWMWTDRLNHDVNTICSNNVYRMNATKHYWTAQWQDSKAQEGHEKQLYNM